MYPNRGDRLAHIERCAARPASVLLADFRCSAGLLLAAITALPGSAWRAPVRTALGRTIPAGEIPWLRVREMWTHLVDLDVGVGFADLPAELVDALLSDAAALLAPRPRCPALLLRPTDRAEPIVLRGASASAGGGGGGGGGPAVTGPASALLGWLTGRATTGVHADPPGPLPPLPRWL
jgi:maleylpyruvate isomerase